MLEAIATQKGSTLAQIALAWLLSQKSWIVPIPGLCKIERVDENIGSVSVGLTTEDQLQITSAMAKISVVGDRY